MTLSAEAFQAMIAGGVARDSALVAIAAVAGEEELDRVLAGGEVEHFEESDGRSGDQPGLFLSSLEVTGFRGIGETSTLELMPGPGLTVVAGRNGSGKSSFADALEVLLTGDSWRWRNKAAEWKQGWRNLHYTEACSARATFNVEGASGPTRIWREWDPSARLAEDGITIVQAHGQKQTNLADHGWAAAVELYRPLLSHSELSVVADNPSSLFDALSGVLGVDELVAGGDLLRRRRLELQSTLKEAKKQLKEVVAPLLDESEDPRAQTAASALGRTWDLDGVDGLVASRLQDPAGEALRRWEQLPMPDPDQAAQLASQIREVQSDLDKLEKSEAGRAARVTALLRLALDEHQEHGDTDCPVCGAGRLDADWEARTTRVVAEFEEAAAAYKSKVDTRQRCLQEARAFVALRLPPDVEGLDTAELRAVAEEWATVPEDPMAVADHLDSVASRLRSALDATTARALAMLEEREDRWQPVGLALAQWSQLARRGLADEEKAKGLKTAEDALAAATEEIRTQRFAPIAEQAMKLWQDLRLQSNVQLEGVELTGKGTRRRVDLRVTVDGAEGAALGVVSQGEVNCLALSLFFPRVMLPDSPFRFIVIDDPVQAMDPARVDGLARVFTDVARDRQLVVFTHDDRLPDSLRRLGLPHTLLQVTRRPTSQVKVTRRMDPVIQYFSEARAVAKDQDAPDGVASRVVPGFCRSGIEAACMEAVRRRRIGRGDAHSDVEAVLGASNSTTVLAALALFDDESAGGKVLGEINKKWGHTAADAFNDSKRGAHQGFAGSLEALIGECQRLAEGLRSAR